MADSGSAGWRFESSRGHYFFSMDYIEIDVTVEPKEQGSDILIAQLSEIDYESFVESTSGFLAYIKESDFDPHKLQQVLDSYSDVLKIQIEQKKIKQQNWNKEWESNFNPIDIDGKCFIRAPFHTPSKSYEYEVVIEPKMSFGTGHHNTTQLMIKKLMELNVREQSLLDMGCGTGVLAIVAGMMGANPILAIDIDDWSIENTIENIERNNINNIVVKKGDSQILGENAFNTILANINKNVLLADMSVYVNNLENGGNLVLSGFFETDVLELSNKADELGLKFEDKMISEQWAMLHFTKSI